ncbi:MAG: alkaline phosphatase D family protein [Myxococcota bacterium]|nr:alkaline phosphatase D family protein [Myxococcota bacterium]
MRRCYRLRHLYVHPVIQAVALLTMLPSADARNGLAAGPMVGYSTHREVVLWMRTDAPETVRVRYWTEGEAGRKSETRPQRTGGEDGRLVHVRIGQLVPGSVYEYEILLGAEQPVVVPRAYPLRFQTQVIWHRRADPPPFVMAFGSCAYTNDAADDAPDKPYGGGYEIYESIRKTSPDLMLWLGDNVYFRPTDWSSRSGMFRRYARSRGLADLQPLLGSVHHYAVWDDHDYGPNDSNRSFVHKQDALDAFRSYWANPSYGLPDHPGVFGQFTWSDVDVFLIDNRYYRSASSAPRTPDKTIVGQRQLQWLLDALSGSSAPFKIVAGGGQFLSPVDRFEGYAQAPHEQRRLISEIVRRKIEGVVFLSGDRHHTELVRLDQVGFYPLYDFTSSPLTSRGAAATHDRDSPIRVPETLVRKQRNFGLIRVDGPKNGRRMTMEARDTRGRLLWSHKIAASELRPPPRPEPIPPMTRPLKKK